MMEKPYRNKKRLQAAKDAPCIRCGRIGETRACHYNGFRSYSFGKGRGIKCNDAMTAYFCHNCDALYSEQNYGAWEGGSKNIERSEEFLFWIAMTTIYLQEQ